jgi:hypothetical protein
MIELDFTYDTIVVQTFSEGVPANATSNTGAVYRNGTLEAGVTVTYTNIATGLYFASFTTLGTDEDWATTDHVVLITTTTIGGLASKATHFDSVGIGGGSSSGVGTVVIGRYTDDDAASPNITCKVGETNKPKSVSVEDLNGDPVDLTDWGAKVLVIERAGPPRTDVQVVTNANITISGDDNETFTFQPNADVLEKPGDFKWALREASTQTVIIDGRLTVSYSPMEDA